MPADVPDRHPTEAELHEAIAQRDGAPSAEQSENFVPDGFEGGNPVGIDAGDLYGPDAAPAADAGKPADDVSDKAAPDADEADTGDKGDADGPKDPQWDTDRQAKDQEIANLRRQVETLEKGASDPPNDQKAADPDPEADGDLDKLEELDEFADEADRNALVNKMLRSQRAQAQRDQTREAAQVARDNSDAFNGLVDNACKTYGEEHRNEIVQRVRTMWTKEGFDADRFPDPTSTKMAVMGVAAQLQNESLRKQLADGGGKGKGKGQERPTPREPAHDSGRRGVTTQDALSTQGGGSIDDEAEAMMAEGKFDWAGQ